MPLCKLHAWFQNVLPTIYDSASLSLYEAMGKVMYKLNEVIDLVNLLEANQPNIETIVINTLNKWLQDGTLTDIINNEVFNNKADGHVLSVTSFGADPTGVNDSTNAFNQAISKAQTDSYKLVVYPGQYKLSSYIFTDYSLFVEDLGTYPNSKLIYCKPLQNRLCSQNFYSFQYVYDTPQTSTSPIPWETQGIFFDQSTNILYCAYQGAFTTSSFDGSKFTKIQTVINSNIGHANTVTKDQNFIYISESPTSGVVKFSVSDLSYQGILTLPNIPADSIVQSFCFNPDNNMFFAYVYNQNSTQTIHLYDVNLQPIKSFNFNSPQVQQSVNWIDNNFIAFSCDSNWAHDSTMNGMFLYVVDIVSESLVYSFPFGSIRSFNECQGFTKLNSAGDYIIYSYSQQNNIQSLFKFNFNKLNSPNILTLNSTNDCSIASIYPNKHLVVNTKGVPYPFNNTVLQNNNNINDSIPVGSDIINVSPYLKGDASYPFATPQAAAANVGKFGAFTIYLCGDTNFSLAPNGHMVIRGADNLTITGINSNSSRMLCPPIYIADCKNVYISKLLISNSLDWSNPHNNHNWASLHVSNCLNVFIENCSVGFASSTDAYNSSGTVEIGSGIYANGIAKLTVTNVDTTNCRNGLTIINSNFSFISYSVTNDKYPVVIGNSMGCRDNASNNSVYTWYASTNPNFTSNITIAGEWQG